MEMGEFRQKIIRIIEHTGLWIIAVATLLAVGQEVGNMIGNRAVSLGDLLLLFIYLEVITMVYVYMESGQLPVRMPLYIGIVALARYLVLDIKNMDEWRMLAVAGAVLLLAVAVLVIRYGHARFPSKDAAGRVPDV